MQAAVERAIDTMWSRYGEPLSLAEIAGTATLSKFYFSRVFHALTGTSPGRFLSAIRLAKAKQLLLETSRSVTEISYSVGYNSLGTFTSRFTHSVGMPPARYRALSAEGIPAPTKNTGSPALSRRSGAVEVRLEVPETETSVRVYVGAFKEKDSQGAPIACGRLAGWGRYRLNTVPDGSWFVRAAVVAMRDVEPDPWNRRPLFVGCTDMIRVRAAETARVEIRVRPVGPLDLPILLALPELDSRTVRRLERVPLPA